VECSLGEVRERGGKCAGGKTRAVIEGRTSPGGKRRSSIEESSFTGVGGIGWGKLGVNIFGGMNL